MNKLGVVSFVCALLVSSQIVYGATIVSAERAIAQQDYAKALEDLRPLAEDGDLDAIYLLGTLYRDGSGVEADPAQAQRYFESAARQGHLESVNALRAIRNTQFKAEFDATLPNAESGVANAQNRIGEMYEFGQGVDRDLALAYDWYARAAESGYIPGTHNLARSYYFGHGVDVDFAEAEALFTSAAKEGYADSMFFLGTLYATHNGGDQTMDSDVIAYAWLESAAARGSETARTIAGRFKMKLTGDLAREADELAAQFKEQYVTPYN